jgi:glucose/mannose transport system substrate-binding protein
MMAIRHRDDSLTQPQNRYAMSPLPFIILLLGLVSVLSSNAAERVDILHWWVSPGERASIQVFREHAERAGLAWHEQAVAGSGTDRYTNVLRARVAAGKAPTAAQMIGYDIQQWAAAGQLHNLDEVALRDEWDEVVPFGIQRLSKYRGHWIAAPINTHSTNWLWINQHLLAQLGSPPAPDTWEDFLALLQRAKNAGMLPLAIGHEAWEHTLLFESVAVSRIGAERYRRAFIDLDAHALPLEMAIDIFARMRLLSAFIDPGFAQRRWDQATDLVRSGKALLQVQGTWVGGEFRQHGLVAPRDYQCLRFPDTQGVVLFNSDQYVFPKTGPGSPEARAKLLEILLEKHFQGELNHRSGAIPARVDVPKEYFDSCAQGAIVDLRGANIRRTLMGSIAMGNANPPAVKQAIYTLVSAHLFGRLDDVQAATGLLRAIAGEP